MNVSVSVSLPIKTLINIQKNVKGKTRAEKIRYCIELGYPIATKASKPTPIKEGKAIPPSLMHKGI